MEMKPSYEELEQRIRQLEAEAGKQKDPAEKFEISDKKFRVLIESADIWINEVDMNGVYTYVNPKVKDVLGYSQKEVIGRTIFDFMPRKEIKRTSDFFKRITGEGKPFSEFVCSHQHKDGREIVLETNGAPFFDYSGNITGYWGLGRDITKRVRAEEALRESEEKWRVLVENAPNIILILDRRGIIQFINRIKYTLSIDDVIGKRHTDFVEPEYHELVNNTIEQVFQSGESGSFIHQGPGPEGGSLWYETQVGPLRKDGKVDAVTLITTDVTEFKENEEALRKAHENTEQQVKERTAELLNANNELQAEIAERMRVETSLQESEQRFRSLVEATTDMVWEIDLKGIYTYVSPKSKELLGYAPEELVGKGPYEFMNEEGAKGARLLLEELSRTQVPFSAYESVVTNKDGLRVNVETGGVPIFDTDGTLLGYRGTDRDITEKIRSKEQMFQAAKMVSLGTVVSGVAHEINNPITSIMLNNPILKKIWDSVSPVLDGYCKEHGDIMIGSASYSQLRERVPVLLSDINDGTRRVKNIVDELKNFAQHRPSDLSDDVDINEVVVKAVGLVSNLIKKTTDQFQTHYAMDIPRFKGNTQHIEQVVINLIINACEALPDKDHAVTVSTAYYQKSNKVVLKVMDQGEGILPEVFNQISDPFFTTKRNMGGTGLGLAISGKIIEDHGGTIDFDSSPGKGTTATVTVPAIQTE